MHDRRRMSSCLAAILLIVAAACALRPPLAAAQTARRATAPRVARWQAPALSSASPAEDAAAETDPTGSETSELLVPLRATPDTVIVDAHDGLISLVARDASLQDVLTALAEIQGLNIITQDTVEAQLTTTLHRVPLDDALDVILEMTGHTWSRNRNIIQVMSVADSRALSAATQGREVEVFHLNYVSATDVDTVVSGMLSPAGRSHMVASAPDDNRRTEELLVVEDLPQYVEAVRAYISRHDLPPRQVLIEAYILQVDLSDELRHGVNFDHMFNISNHLIQIESRGFASATASPGFMVNLSGGNLGALIETLETTVDAKTLAAPKIRVLNGQLARIQVGEQLGFRVTTTTETSTTESVEFLDVGVVLEVTPRIGNDGSVIMRVRPEVSSGEVNPATGLPEEETTELETDVLFRDNQAFVIGGLIQETDSDRQSKLPWIGNWKYIGSLFRRKEVAKQRTEIIIALLPRVMPFDPVTHEALQIDTERATTPLLYGPLQEYPRPWEPRLPDAIENPSFSLLPPLSELRGHALSAGQDKPGYEKPGHGVPGGALEDQQFAPGAPTPEPVGPTLANPDGMTGERNSSPVLISPLSAHRAAGNSRITRLPPTRTQPVLKPPARRPAATMLR